MKNVILFVSLVCASIIWSQKTPGFLGKRVVLEVSAKLNTPVFSKQYLTTYSKNVFLVKQKYVDVAILGAASYAIKRNVMVGATFGISRFRADVITATPRIDPDTSKISDDVELLKEVTNLVSGGKSPALQALPFTVFSFVPKIEFAGSGSLLPMGLSHSIGVGFLIVKPDSRTVAGSTQGRTEVGGLLPIEASTNVQNLTDRSNKGMLALSLQYGLNMRMPINDFMMFNFGILYTGNFFNDAKRQSFAFNTNLVKEERNFYFSREDYVNAVRDRVRSNFISFTAGLSFLF